MCGTVVAIAIYNRKSNIVNPLEIDTHLLLQLGLQVTGQIEFSIIPEQK